VEEEEAEETEREKKRRDLLQISGGFPGVDYNFTPDPSILLKKTKAASI